MTKREVRLLLRSGVERERERVAVEQHKVIYPAWPFGVYLPCPVRGFSLSRLEFFSLLSKTDPFPFRRVSSLCLVWDRRRVQCGGGGGGVARG